MCFNGNFQFICYECEKCRVVNCKTDQDVLQFVRDGWPICCELEMDYIECV